MIESPMIESPMIESWNARKREGRELMKIGLKRRKIRA